MIDARCKGQMLTIRRKIGTLACVKCPKAQAKPNAGIPITRLLNIANNTAKDWEIYVQTLHAIFVSLFIEF